jgi:hypothetical protein
MRNVYWDWKSLSWRHGEKPLTKAQRKQQSAERKRQAAIARQDKQHAKIAERVERKQAKQQAGKQFRQLRSEAKKEARARELVKQDQELWRELYGSQNPFPGKLTDRARARLRKLVRQNTMAKKRKKKKNSRKGKMPAALKAYWAAKRRAKNARKAKRRKKANPKPRRRRRKAVARRPRRRVRNYRKPATRRRRRTSNPRRKRPVKIIKTNLRKGTKAFKQFVSQVRAQYGKARVL